MRLEGKVAIVTGGGQTPGETIGNGRATAILFAREGARVLVVDRDTGSADETCRVIADEGGEASAVEADVSVEEDCLAIVQACLDRYGRIDILHNNVGIGRGDAGPTSLEYEVWERIMRVNAGSVFLMAKAVLGPMREQGSGVITNVSSIAAIASTNLFAYKMSKAAVNAATQALANANARHGIRVNAIMPGLMDTPMAVDDAARARGLSREQVAAPRHAMVPLKGQMGTAWDVANAALFLASDEAKFITGVLLPVDGGQSAKVG